MALEGVADGVIVDLRVTSRHARAGVPEQSLDHVLRNAGVDEAGAGGVAGLMSVDAHTLASFVVHTDRLVPPSPTRTAACLISSATAVAVLGGAGKQATVSRSASGGARVVVGRAPCPRLWCRSGPAVRRRPWSRRDAGRRRQRCPPHRIEGEHRRVAAADAGLHQQHNEVTDRRGSPAWPGWRATPAGRRRESRFGLLRRRTRRRTSGRRAGRCPARCPARRTRRAPAPRRSGRPGRRTPGAGPGT